jgi:glycosyltransferase involved in cell wall biosynthesis
MKTITFAVPCYNSAAYMEKCVDSLLSCDGGEEGAEDVEIIIINDGSQDETAGIAGRYARNFAGVVKVIHQPNAGHGGAINAGLAAAAGKYFKVVDSDDYVDKGAYAEVLAELRRLSGKDDFAGEKEAPDLVVANYVYEKTGRKHHKVINYAAALPEKRIVRWEDTRPFAKGKYLLMHSLIYRTDILRQSGLDLPRRTFYVDNLFAYIPLPLVKTLYYINAGFYRYSIGQAGQSVQENTMIKRIDQQIAVNRLMLESVDLAKVQNKKLLGYMLQYLEIVTCVTMILLIRTKTKEGLEKKNKLWAYIQNYPVAYNFLRRRVLISGLCKTGAAGRRLSVMAYQVVRLIYGFN